MSQLVAAHHACGDAGKLVVFGHKTAFGLALCIEGFDDAQTAERLFDIAQQHAPLCLTLERHSLQALAYLAHHKPCHRQQQEHKYGELPTHGYHRGKAHHYHDGIFEHHVERCHYAVFHLGDVATHTRHHVALALVGEEAHGQVHNLAIDGVAYVAHHAHAYGHHEERTQIGTAGLECGHYHEHHCQRCKCVTCSPAVDYHLRVVVEIVDCHIFYRCRSPRHKGIGGLFYLEEHLQDGYDERKRKQCEKCRKYVEEYVEAQIFLIWWYKSI